MEVDSYKPPPPTISSQPIINETSKATRRRRSVEVKDPDNFLLYLSDILERLHDRFYKEFDKMAKGIDVDEIMNIPTPDLKKVIPEMRHSVLKGTRILFTGVIPTNMPPHKNREWNTARAFGAIIHDRLVAGLHSSDPSKAFKATTHVIAGRPGTSKLREAKRLAGVKVVNPRWLWSCAEQWKLVNEKFFPLEFEKDKSEEKQLVLEGKAPPDQKLPKPPSRKAMKVIAKNCEDTKLLPGPLSRPEPVSTVAAPTEHQPIPVSLSGREEGPAPPSTPPTLTQQTTELDRDSDSDNDDTFLAGENFDHDIEKDTAMLQRLREFKRHMSLESRLSVSDEELEKMDAEVEAEISSSDSSNNSDEDLGTFIQENDEDNNLLSYETYAGLDSSSSQDKTDARTLERRNRKRKYADIEDNSVLDRFNDSIDPSDEEEVGEGEEGGDEDSDDSIDELGALLG